MDELTAWTSIDKIYIPNREVLMLEADKACPVSWWILALNTMNSIASNSIAVMRDVISKNLRIMYTKMKWDPERGI